MTANIPQYVIPRRHVSHGTAQVYTPRLLRRARLNSQKGSINQSTLTFSFGVFLILGMALLGFFYLQQVLNTAEWGADIHSLESKLLELQQEQRTLELEGAELRSLQSVENHVKELNLVGVDRVSYLTTESERVAFTAPQI